MTYDPQLVAGMTTLHGLNGSELAAFLSACVPAHVPAGILLIRKDDLDPSMLFVREGELEVYLEEGEDKVRIRELHRGDHIGAANLLGLSQRRNANVGSVTPATLLVLEREGFEELRRQGNPMVKNLEAEVLRDLVGDLQELLESLRGLARGCPLPAPEARASQQGFLERLASSLRGEREPAGTAAARAGGLCAPPPWLLGPSEQVEVPKATVLLEARGDQRDAFVVLEGRVGRYMPVRSGGHVRLGEVRPGQLGGFELAVDSTWGLTTYVAEERCRLVRVPYDTCADAVIMRDPRSAELRRVMLETATTWHDRARRMLFQSLADRLGSRARTGLSQHPGYRQARALVARRA